MEGGVDALWNRFDAGVAWTGVLWWDDLGQQRWATCTSVLLVLCQTPVIDEVLVFEEIPIMRDHICVV